MNRILTFALMMTVLVSCQKDDNTRITPSNPGASQQELRIIEEAVREYLEDVSSEDSHSLYPLTSGPFPYINGGELGPPKTFWNEMDDDTTCHMLSVDKQQVGWIYSAYKSPSALILFKCIRIEGSADGSGKPDAYVGAADMLFYELIREQSEWKLNLMNIPGLNAFSVANMCGDRIAYWGRVGAEWNTSVFDLKKREILSTKAIGNFEPGTDDISFYPVPEWKRDCSAVLFPGHMYMKEPALVSLEEARSSGTSYITREDAVRLAEKSLKESDMDMASIHFDDAKFDKEGSKWTVLFWEDRGGHDIRGVMVFVTDSENPHIQITFEE